MTERVKLSEKEVKKQLLGNRKSHSSMKLAAYLLPCRIEDSEKK